MIKVNANGFVGNKPTTREFDNGKIASFNLASTKRWKKDGELKEKTTWLTCVVRRDALVNIVSQYIDKGSQIAISGDLEVRDYKDNSGNTRYVTEIIVDELEFLGGKEKEQKTEKPDTQMPF